MTQKKEVLRETDAEAVRLAQTLIRRARHAVIATLDPATGGPIATRVGLSTDHDGTPVILVSALSAHTPLQPSAARVNGTTSPTRARPRPIT